MNKPIKPQQLLRIEKVLGLGSTSQHPSRRRLAIFGAVGIALLTISLWLVLSSRSAATVRYTTEPATRGDLTVVVTATGSVQPTNQVDISSELSGTVRKVNVDFNSEVKVGQILAELDTDKLVATVESSRARLTAAEAKVEEVEATRLEKQRDLTRKTELAERKVISVLDLDTARAAHDRAVAALASARADVGVARAELKLNETNLAKARITSPINGVVLKRNVDPGQTVASSLQAPVLFSIAEDLRQMEVQVDVDEADVGKVKEGQKATFAVDAYPDRKFSAQIRELRYGSEVVQGVVTYKAVLSTDNSELLLRPGMTATAEITVQRVEHALLVPNTALRFQPPAETNSGQSSSFLRKLLPGMPSFRSASPREETGANRTVWVLRDGQPSALPVTVGASDGRRAEVLKGNLTEGQAVIVDAVTRKR
ncbi:MAG: efflux RND transporter periplasmic adaptor subunit [Hyphomicrobiaceae bacterium]|nr:MAG: efflux RND transporter periplasmic adaptor subunit [Hyphomicrobiaceae bacterium]